jgi:hypothetical protein
MSAICRILSLAVAVSVLVVGGAHAAVLTTAGDMAYVDSGQGFKPVATRTTVHPGDVISIGPNGRATLVYDNGCAFTVRPKNPVTVAHNPPSCLGNRGSAPKSTAEVVVGVTTMSAAFGTIIYKAIKGRPSSP